LHQVIIFHQLLHIVRHVGSQVVPTIRKLTDSKLFSADIIENQCLNVIDIIDLQSIQFCLDHVEKPTMKTFNKKNRFGVYLFHGTLCWFKFTDPTVKSNY